MRINRIGLGLRRSESGAAIVEFAIVALPFLGLIFGVLYIALTFLVQQVLETATERASRQLLTGQAQKAGITRDQFKGVVCDALPSLIDCGKVVVDVRAVASFAEATGTPITFDATGRPTSGGQYLPGPANSIVVAQVAYPWASQITPLNPGLVGTGGALGLLKATSVFRTENFQ